MSDWNRAPARGALGLACALLLGGVAPVSMASHVGEELLLDQQVVSASQELLAALQQYQRAPAAQRPALEQRLAQVAAQRRDRMLALIERSPNIAAVRVLPQSIRQRLPGTAQALVEAPVTLRGAVLGMVGDDPERGRSQTRLQLQDDAGQRFELRAANVSTRDSLGWVNKRGALSAVKLDRYLLVLDKRNVSMAAADGTGSTSTTTTSVTNPVQGVQPTLVVMLDFNDKAIECAPTDLQSRLFGSTGATMDQGFRQSSNNMVSFTGQVIGPFKINYSSTGTCDYNGWASAANAAAQSAGFNIANYKRVSYALPRNSSCGWLGLGALGGPTPSRSWVMQCTSTGMFSHEIGHNLTFHHAATPTAEYGDASDPMGAAKLVQSNAANRVMAGWLGGADIQDVASNGGYVVAALGNANAGAPQVLRMRKPDTNEYYYVSMRQPSGVDVNGLWSTYHNTLSIHKATGTLPAYTVLMAALPAGQSWTDAANGITITHQGVSGAIANVSVGSGAATCTTQSPSVAASPASQTGAPGATLSYGVTVTNRNGTACPSSTFALTQTLPAGFSGSMGSSSVTLAPGASTTVTWTVASGTTSADAVYSLGMRASETTVSNAAEAHASYTVLAPVAEPEPPPPPPADTSPPSLSITSPGNGQSVSGRMATIAAQASDASGVSAVQFYVGDKLMGTDSSSPYSVNWNLRKTAKGTHTVRARATDMLGNVSEQSISVTVN